MREREREKEQGGEESNRREERKKTGKNERGKKKWKCIPLSKYKNKEKCFIVNYGIHERFIKVILFNFWFAVYNVSYLC